MTDSAEAGSVPEAAAGNPQSATPPPDNGSAGAGGSWLDGLSEGNRTVAKAKGWDKDAQGLDKALTSYTELEKQLGSSLRPPKEDAAPEEWNAFYDKLGRPKEPTYEFKRPQDYPADLPYDDALAKEAMPAFHDAGLNTKQAQKLHDWFVQANAKRMHDYQQGVAQSITQANDDLIKEWGPKDSELFKTRLELANKALKRLGLIDELKQAGVLLPDGTLTRASLAKAFAVVGDKMFREDTIDVGNMPAGTNPWKASTINRTIQSAIQKKDPALARRLIREAGRNPADYGLPGKG